MPNITQAIVSPGQTPVIEWMTDEEGGARPVECFYGTITELGGEGLEIPFDLCPGSNPRGLEYTFQGYDPSKQYSVEVCARNRQGQSCSQPAIIAPPTDPPSSTTAAPPVQETNVGLIVGVVVAVVVLFCCCLILLLLLLIFCLCCCDDEKRYFPERRGEVLVVLECIY